MCAQNREFVRVSPKYPTKFTKFRCFYPTVRFLFSFKNHAVHV